MGIQHDVDKPNGELCLYLGWMVEIEAVVSDNAGTSPFIIGKSSPI